MMACPCLSPLEQEPQGAASSVEAWFLNPSRVRSRAATERIGVKRAAWSLERVRLPPGGWLSCPGNRRVVDIHWCVLGGASVLPSSRFGTPGPPAALLIHSHRIFSTPNPALLLDTVHLGVTYTPMSIGSCGCPVVVVI